MDFYEWLIIVKNIVFYNYLDDEEFDVLYEEYNIYMNDIK